MKSHREEVIIKVSSIVEEREGHRLAYDKMEVFVEGKLFYDARIVMPVMSKLTPEKKANYINSRDIIRFANQIREASVDFSDKVALRIHNC